MSKNEEDLQEVIRKLKNQKVREWRTKNKDKVKAINQRYWLKKAKEFKEKQEEEK